MTRAGLPTTTAPAGTSRTTTAPAPTSAFSPTTTPGRSVALAPILAPLRITGPGELILDARRQRILGVGEHDVRTDPAALLEHGVLGNEDLRVNPHVVADLDVMLDDRQRPDADVVADAVRFADVDLVAGLEVPADDVAGVDHGVRADHGAVADAWSASSPSRAPRGGVPTMQKSSTIDPSPSVTFS